MEIWENHKYLSNFAARTPSSFYSLSLTHTLPLSQTLFQSLTNRDDHESYLSLTSEWGAPFSGTSHPQKRGENLPFPKLLVPNDTVDWTITLTWLDCIYWNIGLLVSCWISLKRILSRTSDETFGLERGSKEYQFEIHNSSIKWWVKSRWVKFYPDFELAIESGLKRSLSLLHYS